MDWKKTLSFGLLLILVFPCFSKAEVIYPQNQTVYVSPNPYYETGQAIGNFLSALITASQQEAQEKQIQETLEKINSDLKIYTQKEVFAFANLISRDGKRNAMNLLDNMIYQNGYRSEKGNSNGIEYTAYAFQPVNDTNCPYLVLEYSINSNTKQCRVVASYPDFNINQVAVENYIEPQPIITVTQSVGDRLGIITSEEKTVEGGFRIIEIKLGGTADLAGLKTNDIIIKIDNYDLKGYTLDRVASYVDMRCKQHALLRCTVVRQGLTEEFAMQL